MTIKTLTLIFPEGERFGICADIAKYAGKISNFNLSQGGLKTKKIYMPQEEEEGEVFKLEFSKEHMEYTYAYRKEGEKGV